MSAIALDEAVRLSERMLAAAREGNWDDLVALEAERGRLLSSSVHALQEGGAAERIARVIELNAEIIALGETHRDGLMRSFKSNLQRRHAAGAYAGARG